MSIGRIIYIVGILVFGFGAFYFDGEGRFWSIALGVVWLITGLIFMSISSKVKKELEAPKHTVYAKAISKASKISGGAGVGTTYYVSFEFDNLRQNFKVDVAQYNIVVENETGVLTYKKVGERFIFVDFQPQ